MSDLVGNPRQVFSLHCSFIVDNFAYFPIKHVTGAQKNCLSEVIPMRNRSEVIQMRTHKMYFYGENYYCMEMHLKDADGMTTRSDLNGLFAQAYHKV